MVHSMPYLSTVNIFASFTYEDTSVLTVKMNLCMLQIVALFLASEEHYLEGGYFYKNNLRSSW